MAITVEAQKWKVNGKMFSEESGLIILLRFWVPTLFYLKQV